MTRNEAMQRIDNACTDAMAHIDALYVALGEISHTVTHLKDPELAARLEGYVKVVEASLKNLAPDPEINVWKPK